VCESVSKSESLEVKMGRMGGIESFVDMMPAGVCGIVPLVGAQIRNGEIVAK
jgi:hypothetical protein